MDEFNSFADWGRLKATRMSLCGCFSRILKGCTIHSNHSKRYDIVIIVVFIKLLSPKIIQFNVASLIFNGFIYTIKYCKSKLIFKFGRDRILFACFKGIFLVV